MTPTASARRVAARWLHRKQAMGTKRIPPFGKTLDEDLGGEGPLKWKKRRKGPGRCPNCGGVQFAAFVDPTTFKDRKYGEVYEDMFPLSPTDSPVWVCSNCMALEPRVERRTRKQKLLDELANR